MDGISIENTNESSTLSSTVTLPSFYQTQPTIRSTAKQHHYEEEQQQQQTEPYSDNNNQPQHSNHHHHHHHHHHHQNHSHHAGHNLHDTGGQISEQDERNLREYKDRIRHINLNRILRRFLFLPIPERYCSRLWCVKDGLGVVGCVFTWMLIVFGEIVFTIFVLIPFQNSTWSALNGAFSIGCAFLGFVAHVKAMFTDPGAVPRGTATKENIAKLGLKDGQIVYKCPKCVSIKPERAHHCSVCRRCIRKMDHHCPWVNNCVGENNQKYFILFTFYICMISIHSLYMSIHHFVICVRDDWKECTAYSPAATTIFLIFLLFESLLFGIFTAIMCGTQLSAVCTDETGIESLKSEEGSWEKKSWWWSLKSVFGHPFSYKWFSPFHTVYLGKQEVYLYTV